jgi:signal transduction histidine kinase
MMNMLRHIVAVWYFAFSFISVAQCATTAQALRLDQAIVKQGNEADAQSELVQLPDSWNKSDKQGTWDYQLSFTLDELPSVAWGIYLPRVGNRFSVQLNGQKIAQQGLSNDTRSDYAQKPHYFFLPNESLRLLKNQLVIKVHGDKARYAGLAAFWVGPVDELRPKFVLREIMQTWGSFSIMLVAVIFGFISAGLAYSTRDHSFTIFSAACAFCAIRTSYAVVTHIPFDYSYWNFIVDTCYAAYLICLCLFCMRVINLKARLAAWFTGSFVALSAVLVPLYAFTHNPLARQVWLLSMVVYAMCMCGLIIHAWYKLRTTATRVLAIAAGLSVALAIYDHLVVFYTADGYGSMAVARYSLLIFLVAMGWVLVNRSNQQMHAERNYRKQLAVELEARTLELSTQFKKQEQLISLAAHHEEQKRLMQDLHDSMGLQLNTLLVMVEKGGFRQDELTGEVRTTIEQMRMLVDGAQTFDGNFEELLGHIRYRIESRLRRCDIALKWHTDYAGLAPHLSDAAGKALQRLIFELCTNVIKHAKASRVQLDVVAAVGQPRTLQVVFSDNGVGFLQPDNHYGMGTTSMRHRLDELKATATHTSTAQGGLQYLILIPC